MLMGDRVYLWTLPLCAEPRYAAMPETDLAESRS